MSLPSHHIIEKIRQHADEINSHHHDIFKLELWYYHEKNTVEGFQITNLGSTLIKDDFKQQQVKDIEEEHTKQFHSSHSPQEQNMEKQEEIEKPRTDAQPFSINIPITKLSKLTPPQRDAFFLWYSGLSDQNAARIKNIHKKSYQEQLKQALKKLGIHNQIISPPPKISKRKMGEKRVYIKIPEQLNKKISKPHKPH